MMEQHGYVNWSECGSDIEMLLESGEMSYQRTVLFMRWILYGAGFPQLRLEPQHSRLMRFQDFYQAILYHSTACKICAETSSSTEDGEKSLSPMWLEILFISVPSHIVAAVSKLSRPPHQAPTLKMRVNFGRWLSRFLNERGYQSWPGWFSNGRVLHVILRSTFPPLKQRKKAALRSLTLLSSTNRPEERIGNPACPEDCV